MAAVAGRIRNPPQGAGIARPALQHPLMVVALYLVAYLVLDRISYILPVLPLGISPWNPPTGLTLFLLLSYGLRYWPAIPVACFAAELLTRGLPSPLPLAPAAACITLGYGACAWVLRRRLSGGCRIESAADLAWFAGATVVATLLVAASYVAIFTAFGQLRPDDFGSHFLRFWVGDLDGVLVVTPLLLTLRHWRPARPTSLQVLEMGAQALALMAALWLVFRQPNLAQYQFFYVLFLPLVWIVARHGLHGAVVSLAVTQIGLILVVPTTEVYARIFISYQFLLLSLCVTGLMLGVFGAQRRRADAALHDKNAQLAKALQLAAAGELSSALAHELNQPITAINNYVQSCRLMLDAPEPGHPQLADTLDRAVRETQRAGNVVRKLRDFFQNGSVALERTELGALVRRVLQRLAARAQKLGVTLDLRAESESIAVNADPMQLELVVHNILVNALDAIEHARRPRGLVQIAVAQDGGHARITIDDDGPGVSAALVDRLFQPFTTSKPDGMGLGLAISRSLIEAHGSTIEYQRSPLGGGRFQMSLARAGDPHA